MAGEPHWQRWRLLLATIVLGVSGLVSWLVFGGDGASECSEAWSRIPTSLDNPTDQSSYSSVVDLCSDRQLRDELEAWISRRSTTP